MLTQVKDKKLPKGRNGRTEGSECAKFPRGGGAHGENEVLNKGQHLFTYSFNPLTHNQCLLCARHCSWY